MNEYRCAECNKLVFKGNFTGTIQVKCSRCDEILEFESNESTLDYAFGVDYTPLDLRGGALNG